MELYTSLVRLKQAMNGGQLPPMTPLAEGAQRFLDQAFTIGMGGLIEDVRFGLRCPVKGCGRFFHNLGHHVTKAHPGIGGAMGLRKLLSIPPGAPLVSERTRERMCAANAAPMRRARVATLGRANAGRRSSPPTGRRWGIVGERNLRDRCEAQLAHRIIDLHNELGRSPTGAEFANKYDVAMLTAVERTFGSWNNAKELCGLDRCTPRNKTPRQLDRRRSQVLPGLEAWHAEHGDLPSVTDVDRADRTPAIPSKRAILAAMETDSWPEAMRRAASMLNIYGGRYGLPPREGVA